MNQEGYILLYIIFAIVFFEAIAQFCVKKSKTNGNNGYLCISVFAYFMVCLLLLRSYSYKTMGMVNLVCSCLSIITIIFIGTFFYHEKITNFDIIGIVFILTGLYFVFMKDHKKEIE